MSSDVESIEAVREGHRKDADDTETLTLRQDGHVLTVTGAPPARNRIEPGVREVMRRSVLTHDVTGTWEDLRQWAAGLGLFIDPDDYPSDEPSRAERYSNSDILRAVGLSR